MRNKCSQANQPGRVGRRRGTSSTPCRCSAYHTLAVPSIVSPSNADTLVDGQEDEDAQEQEEQRFFWNSNNDNSPQPGPRTVVATTAELRRAPSAQPPRQEAADTGGPTHRARTWVIGCSNLDDTSFPRSAVASDAHSEYITLVRQLPLFCNSSKSHITLPISGSWATCMFPRKFDSWHPTQNGLNEFN